MLKGHTGPVWSLQEWNGYLCSASSDCTIRVWNSDGECVKVLHGHGDWKRSDSLIVWRDHLYTIFDHNALGIWNRDWYCEKIISAGGGAYSLTIWRDLLCVSTGYRIKILNESGHWVKELKGHTGHVRCLQEWNGFLCSGSEDKSIRVWNSDGECVKVLKAHTDWVRSLAVWKDCLCSSSDDGTVRIWNRGWNCEKTLEVKFPVLKMMAWKNLLFCAQVTSLRRGTIRVWHWKDKSCVVILRGHQEGVTALTVWNDTLFSGSYDIRSWHLLPSSGQDLDPGICNQPAGKIALRRCRREFGASINNRMKPYSVIPETERRKLERMRTHQITEFWSYLCTNYSDDLFDEFLNAFQKLRATTSNEKHFQLAQQLEQGTKSMWIQLMISTEANEVSLNVLRRILKGSFGFVWLSDIRQKIEKMRRLKMEHRTKLLQQRSLKKTTLWKMMYLKKRRWMTLKKKTALWKTMYLKKRR